MDISEILSKVDHTNLKQTATNSDIEALIDDAVKYKTASVCIAPCFVKHASEYSNGRTAICTVIGFPNGYNTTAVKCFEAKTAVADGADEIDMVINIGMLKRSDYQGILQEINAVKQSINCKLLKVIIETCLLNTEEKIKMCEVISVSNADYIKTSTGFSTDGATFEDISLFKKHITNGKRIKAAGGISSIADAEKFINLGADRLGTSRIVTILKRNEANA